jgi:hypothetical protein
MKLVVNAAADSCSLPIRIPDPGSDRARRSCRGSDRRAAPLFRGLPCVLVALLLLVAAGAAPALDGIDLGPGGAGVGIEGEGEREATADGCSRLFRIKYPFLSCMGGRIGSKVVSATWENSRRMPTQSDWIEGDGAWGPELNPD